MARLSFLMALLSAAKKEGLHTAVETCGFAPREAFEAALPLVDLFLYDYKETDPDLSGYDRVGLASGIYYGTLAKQLITWAKERLPEGKDIFLIVTQGAASGDFLKEIRGIAEEKHCRLLGSYTCRGFDTFGPFKLVGGIAKGHPTEEEIRKAVSFYAGL